MLEKKDHVKRIQEITFEAYKSSGRIGRASGPEYRPLGTVV